MNQLIIIMIGSPKDKWWFGFRRIFHRATKRKCSLEFSHCRRQKNVIVPERINRMKNCGDSFSRLRYHVTRVHYLPNFHKKNPQKYEKHKSPDEPEKKKWITLNLLLFEIHKLFPVMRLLISLSFPPLSLCLALSRHSAEENVSCKCARRDKR